MKPEFASSFLNRDELIYARSTAWRDRRLHSIAHRDIQFALIEGPCLVFHIVPALAVTSTLVLDAEEISGKAIGFQSFGHGGGSPCFNADGYAVATSHEKTKAYSQMFRTGVFEGVDADVTYASDGQQVLRLALSEKAILAAANAYLQFGPELGLAPPHWCHTTVIGAKGVRAIHNHDYSDYSIDRNVLHLPDVRIENPALGIAAQLRPTCNALWNALGYQRSWTFEESCKDIGLECDKQS